MSADGLMAQSITLAPREQAWSSIWKKVMVYYIYIKHLKVVAKCCLHWVFPHGAICCFVRYLLIEYEEEIFKTYH